MSTAILKQWSPMNQAWLVWRDDDGHQSGVRVHLEEWEADRDVQQRQEFLKQVEEQEFKQWSYYK